MVKLAELSLETEGSVVHATLRGDIDLSNTRGLREELNAAVTNTVSGVIVDLTEVTYLDSAGIHLFHRLREDLRAHGQRLKLVLPPDSIINATLRLAGLDWSRETVETSAAARLALADGS